MSDIPPVAASSQVGSALHEYSRIVVRQYSGVMSDEEKGEYRSLLTQRGIQPESFPVQQQPDCKSRPHDSHVCHAFAMSLLEVEGLQDIFLSCSYLSSQHITPFGQARAEV